MCVYVYVQVCACMCTSVSCKCTYIKCDNDSDGDNGRCLVGVQITVNRFADENMSHVKKVQMCK